MDFTDRTLSELGHPPPGVDFLLVRISTMAGGGAGKRDPHPPVDNGKGGEQVGGLRLLSAMIGRVAGTRVEG